MTSMTSYFVSCCFYVRAICEHFDFVIKSIEKDVELNRDEKNVFEYKQRELKIEEDFCKAINIHIKVNE